MAAQLFKSEGSQASCGAHNYYLDMAQGREEESMQERGVLSAHSTALSQNKPKQSALADHDIQYHLEAVGEDGHLFIMSRLSVLSKSLWTGKEQKL